MKSIEKSLSNILKRFDLERGPTTEFDLQRGPTRKFEFRGLHSAEKLAFIIIRLLVKSSTLHFLEGRFGQIFVFIFQNCCRLNHKIKNHKIKIRPKVKESGSTISLNRFRETNIEID